MQRKNRVQMYTETETKRLDEKARTFPKTTLCGKFQGEAFFCHSTVVVILSTEYTENNVNSTKITYNSSNSSIDVAGGVKASNNLIICSSFKAFTFNGLVNTGCQS